MSSPPQSHLPLLPGLGRIQLQGLTFSGRHGWFESERERERPFTVDIAVLAPLDEAAESDALGDTLDYNALAATVQAVVEGPSLRLIERMAGAIADALLAEHPLEAAEVTVHKPTPGVAGAPTFASVSLIRHRNLENPGSESLH